MDSDNARFLLGAFRSNGADVGDAVFAEALAATREDARLGEWFAREQRGDRAITAVMREIRAPAGLRDQILGGAAVTMSERAPYVRRIILAGLAAAASIALVIFMLSPNAQRARPFDIIVQAACAEAHQPVNLSFYASASDEVLTWLNREKAPAPDALPVALAALPTIGCRTLSWSGVPASEVCFRSLDLAGGARERSSEPTLHLYTVHQSSCSGGGAGRTPVVFGRDGLAVATWRDRTHFYILVGDVPEDALRTLLSRGDAAVALTALARAKVRVPVDV